MRQDTSQERGKRVWTEPFNELTGKAFQDCFCAMAKIDTGGVGARLILRILMQTTTGKALVFVNASSGWDAKEGAPEKLATLFEEAGVDAEVQYVRKGVNLAELAREAVHDGAEVVVAGGGDGTLSAVAAGLIATDVAFGVLPVGTLNHFARDLKIPLDLDKAAQVVLQGNSTYVDVGEVNGKTFLNNSILGLYPVFRFLRATAERSGWTGKLGFLRALVGVFYRFPWLKVRLHLNGQEQVRKTPYILVANNEHAMTGYRLGERKSLTDGKLWLYVMKPHTRWGLVWMLLHVLTGQFTAQRFFDVYSVEDVWVETKAKRIGVALDGEIAVMKSPLHYRILPRGLRVLVPAGE